MAETEFRRINHGFLLDANAIDDHGRVVLVEFLSEKFSFNTKAGKLRIFGELQEQHDLFRQFGIGFSHQSPTQLLGYHAKAIKRSGGIRDAIAPYLAWLSLEHPDEAHEIYERLGLARTDMPFRQVRRPDHPIKQSEPSPPRDESSDPRAVIPRDYYAESELPPLDDGLPTRAPVKFPHPDGLRDASFSPDGTQIITASRQGDLIAGAYTWRIDNLSQDTARELVATHEVTANFAAFYPTGHRIITAAKNRAFVWHAGSRTVPIFELRHDLVIPCCSFSSDGSKIATASYDQTASIWCAKRGTLLKTMRPNLRRTHTVNTAVFSPDDQHLLLGCSDGSISIWDIESESQISALSDYDTEGVCSAVYSRDGKTVLTSNWNGTAALWDVDSGKTKFVLGEQDRHGDTVWSAYFSNDENFVLTASDDCFAFIWDVETSEIIGRLEHPAKLYVAHFSPDNRSVLTACDDGSAYLWRVA